MNILHILSRFDSYDAVHTTLELSKYLNINNHNSTIASSLNGNRLENIAPGLPYYKITPFERDVKNFFVSYHILKDIAISKKIDIIHIHSISSMWLAFLVCRSTQARLAISCYNFHHKNIINQGLILANKVIVHNETVGKQLINSFNLSQDKVQFIDPGIDIDNFKFQGIDERPKTDFTIGVIPSFIPESGYEYFLKAMVKVVRIIPYVNISILISSFHSRRNIKEDLEFWTRRLGLTNYVKFIDTSNFDLRFLTKFNLLVYAPIKENALIRAVMEAQAYGIPVIAGHVAGLSQIILDNKTGVLIPPKDNSSLANAIIKILKEFSFTRGITLAARKRLEEEFRTDKNINSLIDTYKELKNKKKILVVNLGDVNDVVSVIPVLNLLRKNMANSEITALISPNLRCLLQRCPYIHGLILYDISKNKRLFGFIRVVRLIIEKRFDMVFDFNNSFKSQIISYLSLASNRYGYRNRVFNFLINNHMGRPKLSNDLIKDNLSILGLGLRGIDTKDYRLELWPSQEDEDFIEEFFQNHWIGAERKVSLDIWCKGKLFEDKKTIKCLVYLCNSLAKQHIRVILIGSKENHRIKDELFKMVNPKSVAFIEDISYNQLACLIKKCQLYISLHYNFIHIAIAMRVPSLVISGNSLNGSYIFEDVAHLTLKDFPLANKKVYRRNRIDIKEEKNIVMQTIDNLMESR